MKIIFGSWNRETDNNFYTFDNVGSGYENIAACLDGRWHVLSKETKNEYDLVLCCCPSGTDKVAKPDCWKKLLLVEEAGFGVLNTHWFYEKLFSINFDGILCHTSKLKPLFESLNKSVYDFFPPYPFQKVSGFPRKQTVPNKVCLNMSRLFTFESNIAGTIRLCQLLPEMDFVSYCCNNNELNKIIQKAGVTNWKVFPHLSWQDFIQEASDCSIFASLDNRYTWGRFQLDAVALGKPCVGAYSATQELFYPKEFCVEPTDVEGLACLIKKHIGTEFQADPLALNCIGYDYFKEKLNLIK